MILNFDFSNPSLSYYKVVKINLIIRYSITLYKTLLNQKNIQQSIKIMLDIVLRYPRIMLSMKTVKELSSLVFQNVSIPPHTFVNLE